MSDKSQRTLEEQHAVDSDAYLASTGIPWRARDAFYGTVGQAISMWASMEERIVQIASVLLATDAHKAGIVFYSVINFNVWLNIVEDLLRTEPDFAAFLPKWNDHCTKLRRLNNTRVRLAHHSVWHNEKPALALSASKFDKRRTTPGSPLTEEEILTFTQAVLQHDNGLTELYGSLAALRTKDASGEERSKHKPRPEGD